MPRSALASDPRPADENRRGSARSRIRLAATAAAPIAAVGSEDATLWGILVVDGNNVIGAVADGWWRDRPMAARRLLARLECLGERATLVLDVAQPDLPEGDHGRIAVRYATRRGRDAADDLIRELVADDAGVTVVTSDRSLQRDVEAAGAKVIGSGTFLARLDAAGC